MGIHPQVGLFWCFDFIPPSTLFNCAPKKGNYLQSVIPDLRSGTWATGPLEKTGGSALSPVSGETDGAARG